VLREERLAHNHFCPHDVPSFERARQIVDFMQVVAPQNIEVLFDEEGGRGEDILRRKQKAPFHRQAILNIMLRNQQL